MTLEQEIQHSAKRMHDLSLQWLDDQTPSQEIATGLRSLAEYQLGLAGRIEASLVVEPPPVELEWPSRVVGGLNNWDAIGSYALRCYGGDVLDLGGDTFSGGTSAVAIIYAGGTIKNGKLTQAGGDGIKVINGSAGATVENIHVYGIGHASEAHADALQITGGVSDLKIIRFVADIPGIDSQPGASPRSNACLIISSQDAPNGRIDVIDSDLYGGGFSVYNRRKPKTGQPTYTLADLHFTRTRFYVNPERTVPAYGLFSCDERPSFTDCQVIEFGTWRVLSDDPWAWNSANFGS